MRHRLLSRQLHKLHLEEQPPDATTWQAFLEHVHRAYTQADQDRYLIERSLALSSQELQQHLTELAQAHAALRLAEEQLRTVVVSNAPLLIFAVDPSGMHTLSEGQALAGLGRQPGAEVGQSVFDVYRDSPVMQLLFRQALAGETVDATVELNGGSFDARLVPQRDADGALRGVIGVAFDVTARMQAEAQLAHQAFHDTLTGLPNRTLFLDRLEHAQSRAARARGNTAVLFFDLDRFKLVNDTLGHAVGDALLIEAAVRLRSVVRASDTVARLGGDEFTVLLEEVSSPADALQVAQAVVLAFQQPLLVAEHELYVTVSVGVVCGLDAGLNGQEFLRRADVALYQAKAGGRSCAVLYDVAMDVNTEERLGLEADLRRAIERNELVLYYQPDVSLATGQVTGVEALVRWQHPRIGLVPPMEFIPLAEETGLIRPIGSWVLREACRQAMQWRAAEPQLESLVMSVNLSARQLEDPAFVEEVASVLAETGLPPSCLRLELTESMVMRRVEEMIPLMYALKALGLQLAIDDFGTGYSSLSHLARFPVDTLKIDQSFVQKMGTDAGTTAIVNATVALAHALHVEVTAEGIELPDQLVRLRRQDCDRGQGYYFAHPLPAAAIVALLTGSLPLAAARSA